jgi:hypothetical protein
VPAKTDVVSLVLAAAKAVAGETLTAEEQSLIDANSERPGPLPRIVEDPAEIGPSWSAAEPKRGVKRPDDDQLRRERHRL